MSRGNSNQPSPFFFILIILIVIGLVISFSPGMLFIGLINHTGLIYLDKGQLWAFAILVSVIIFTLIYFKLEKDFRSSLKMYGIISLSIVAILALFYYGFKIEFPATLASYFF
jgi:hypothetical protein